MVSMTGGAVNAFALNNLQERGTMFVNPTDPVYEGQIVAENSRDNDMAVNPTTAKKLTNMRTTSSDENIILKPARVMTLEQALEYIEEDELVEATPVSIRLGKEKLTENERKKAGKKKVETVVRVGARYVLLGANQNDESHRTPARIGLVEGVSFLLLVGVAMPLKYAAGMPTAVKVVG